MTGGPCGPVVGDGGRQHERTALAWLRTALALTAASLLLIRDARTGDDGRLLAVLVVCALAAGLAVADVRSEVLVLRPDPAEAPWWVVQVLVGALVALQLASFVVVL